jgi:hypothetical protein
MIEETIAQHMYMIEETAVLTYVHDRGDNTPTHMYMIEETIALTHVHDRGDDSLNICT